MIIAWPLRARPAQRYLLPLLLLLLGSNAAASAPRRLPAGEIKVHNIDVGQGSATLIQTMGGKNILVDTGWDFAGQRLVAYLKRAGVKKLDALIVSHRHMDHIGGVKAVAEAFPVKKVIGPWDQKGIPASAMSHLAHLRRDLGMSKSQDSRPVYETAIKGKVFNFGDGFSMETLWPNVTPSGKRLGGFNEESVAMRAVQRAPSRRLATFFVGGDLSVPEERFLARTMPGKLRVDWMVANHHGSPNSAQREFMVAAYGGYSRMLRSLIAGEEQADPAVYRPAMQLKEIGRGEQAAALLKQLDPLCKNKPQLPPDSKMAKVASAIREQSARDPKKGARYVVYSVGPNAYGHPNATRMSEAQLAGFTPVTTASNGSVIMSRRIGGDGQWTGPWEAKAQSSKDLPRVRVPRWLMDRDPEKPFNEVRREANSHWTKHHPHPEVGWNDAWDHNATWSKIASTVNHGRKKWIEEYVLAKQDATEGTRAGAAPRNEKERAANRADGQRRLMSMQHHGPEWHGLDIGKWGELTKPQLRQVVLGGNSKKQVLRSGYSKPASPQAKATKDQPPQPKAWRQDKGQKSFVATRPFQKPNRAR